MEQEEVFEGERRDYRTDGKKWQNETESRCEGGKWLTLRQVASLHRIPVGKRKKKNKRVERLQEIYLSSRFIWHAADTAGCGAPLIWCLTSSLSQQISILFYIPFT